MSRRYHESRSTGSHSVSTSTPHLVRSDTSSGAWAGLYEVTPDGGCQLLGRTARWEPLKAVRARVSTALGVRREAA